MNFKKDAEAEMLEESVSEEIKHKKPTPDLSEWLKKVRLFCVSRMFMIITVVLGALFIALQAEVAGAIFFVLLISALLVVCDDLLAILLPILTLSISVLQMYDSFDTFIKFVWVAVFPVAALIFHFIAYRQKIKIGVSFWGIIAVAVAVTLGGVGTIPRTEYFSPVALYYVVMLGFGMAGLYLLIKSQTKEHREYDIREKLVDIMYIAGFLACFQVLEIYAECIIQDGVRFSDIANEYKLGGLFGWTTINMDHRLQPSNNISTFIMIFLPFVFYRAVKCKKLHLLTVVLFMISIFLTKSRGGIVCGSIELILCFACAAFIDEKRVWKWIYSFFALVIVGGAVYYLIDDNILHRLQRIIVDGEARVLLIERSIEDFFSNPILGKGIGSLSNSDIYPGKEGTIIWYHMMIPQIIGSMGLLGIFAYGGQLIVRIYLTVKKLNPFVLTLAMSYTGLLLMSQVNPGEFCPIPYGLIAVILFIVMENEPDRVEKHKKLKKTKIKERINGT